MLRLILNIIVLIFIVQTVRALARGGSSFFRKLFGSGDKGTSPPDRQTPDAEAYSEITPYDIEDAEFEEIRD